MLQVPVAVIGMIGSAFMVASFAPGAVGHSPDAGVAASTIQAVAMLSKADRLSALSPPSERHIVSVVELVGVSHVKVVLKDAKGQVLFESDPQTNTTLYSKNTDLPVLTLKEEQASDVTRKPVSRSGSQQNGTPPRKTQPHGCVGSVSPLAQAGKEAGPSLCVTSITQLSSQG